MHTLRVFLAVNQIKEIVEGEATDLERYQEEMRRYKLIHSESPLFRLPEEDLAAFYTTETATSSRRSINGMAYSKP